MPQGREEEKKYKYIFLLINILLQFLEAEMLLLIYTQLGEIFREAL